MNINPKEANLFLKETYYRQIHSHYTRHHTRSHREWKPTIDILDNFAQSVEHFTPRTFTEAMASKDRDLWQEAIKKEIQSHIDNETLRPCTLPSGRKAVPLGWVFKIKDNPDGSKRYKARIIMKGFLQREVVDFVDTYAPVAKWSSIRILLALTINSLRVKGYES